ncbi:MAG: TIGR00730 family Rossman fold protein [Bdellovibrionales bacterium]|nr:TIGR00730 family Rossman fold protein [Bdellovibrionales bacterium]
MRICIFCSSKLNFVEELVRTSKEFALWMASRRHTLVYGGATVGMMGLLADGVLEGGGEVVGVIPRAMFAAEVPHRKIQTLLEVEDLMERKKEMIKRSDVFVILPGGVGTLDELLEVITWKSIGLITHPIVILNIDGFWNSFFSMMSDLKNKKVLDENLLESYSVVNSYSELKIHLEGLNVS